MENTQVRFANISIKASDEFMTAVDEQRKYGDSEYIIYKKLNDEVVMTAPQDEKGIHYSSGIPSKQSKDYEILKTFSSFIKLKNWISKKYKLNIEKDTISDINKRDIFGDFVVSLKDNDYDLAIKQSGDFML